MKTHLAGKLLSVFLVVVFLILLFEIQPASGHNQRFENYDQDFFWISEDVGPTGSCFDMQVSLALGKEDMPHASYYDSENSALVHAQRMDAGWVNTIVDDSGAVGRHSSIALDSAANPHIAYRNMSTNELEYASFGNSAWNHQTVGSGEYGWFPSLSIDQYDRPHIAYLGYAAGVGSQTPKYALWDGNQWMFSVIDKVFTSGGISLALDVNSIPHVSYQTGGALRHAVYTSTKWITQTVDSIAIGGGGVGIYSSMAIDAAGNPKISYGQYGTNISPPYPAHLKYAQRQGGVWQYELPDKATGAGFFSSLKLDSQDHPYIGYYDSDLRSLKVAHWDGINWNVTVVDSPVSMEGYTSLAIGADNLPRIAYCDGIRSAAKFARMMRLDQHLFLPITVGSSN
jgi:hypothetical protein